jgi:toxin YoeB
MGKFRVIISGEAQKDIKNHVKSGDKAAINKIKKILIELELHPETGTGSPEQLKYNLKDFWSWRINRKDRMIYSISENTATVEILSALGHYSDK